MAADSISTPAREAISDALDALSPHSREPRIAALSNKLEALSEEPDDAAPGEDREEKVVKALLDAEQIAKTEGLPSSTRETARKAALALQREQLAKVNPAAADAWQATSGVRHGID